MKFSQKADYALRAMIDLSLHAAAGGFTNTPEIARRTGTPAKFLEAILGDLRRAGLIESQRGALGGHRLARPATAITAGEVWRAVDGPTTLAARLGGHRATGNGSGRALLGLWRDVERAVQQAVDSVTLDALGRRARELANVQDFNI